MSDDRPADEPTRAPGHRPDPISGHRPDPGRRKGLDGRTIGGRYLVLRTVAAGANTLIADAHDDELDRTVTIKLVRPELSESDAFRRNFRKQMEQMAALSHPNLATVHDWGEEQIGRRGTVYVVVEYLSGGSLRDLFDRGRYLTPSQALMVGLEACRGLDFAHRKGLVHTELTPSKLVFGDDRRLRIVDFGLARILGERDWEEPSRVATHVARYASPEQAEGKPLDGHTDVYSLALILIEAVTGAVPFVGESTVATLSARIGKLMKVSADLGPLAAVLERAGRPEPSERFTASQFGRALVRTAEKLPRPTPVPILVQSRFENPAAMRAPNDPTGGIARPPAEAGPALVASTPTPVSPTDETIEIAPKAISNLAVPAAVTAVAATAAAADFAAPSNVDAVAPAGPTTEQPDGGGTTKARRGAGAEPTGEVAKPAVTQSRRARKKEAKARLKAAKKQEKQAAKDVQKGKTKPAPVAAMLPPAVPVGPAAAVELPKRRRWLPWLVGLFLLAVLAGLGLLASVLFRTPTHEVPAVVGLPRDEALALVDDFDWEITVDDGRSDEYRTPGQVILTTPSAGEDLAEGSPLLIVVSQGPEFRSVPDLSGMTLDEAEAEIERLELVPLDPTTEYSEDVPAGTVISNSVEGVPTGGDVLPGAEVALVVSDGPQPRRVPQLRGLTEDEATQLLDDLGLTLALGQQVFDDEIPAGEIATQNLDVDTSIDRGGTITANVSKGPDLVTFPDLTGMTLPEIGQALTDAGLRVGNLLGSTQGTFVAASVDGDEVSAGEQVRRNSPVNIIILV
jgi:beta-lactam-binding protein with PASTA domain/serine/threonine protein kinase